MNINFKLKRRKIKYMWKNQERIFLKDSRISDEEHMLIKSIKKTAVNPLTHILTSSFSNKKYIINKRMGIYIIMDGTSFSIVSERSRFMYQLNHNISDYLLRFVINEMERKRKSLEREIENIVLRSLNTLM